MYVIYDVVGCIIRTGDLEFNIHFFSRFNRTYPLKIRKKSRKSRKSRKMAGDELRTSEFVPGLSFAR